MADHEEGNVNGGGGGVAVAVHDINTLFSSSERDYLIRHNGDQVHIHK